MNKYVLLILSAVFFMGLFSCETMEDPEIKNTSTWPMNGEYWVQHDGSPSLSGYHKVIITNTAADDGKSILIDDHGLGFLIKSNVDMESKTFEVSDYSVNDSTTVSISNGALLTDGTQGPQSEVVTDSLYMEVEVVGPSTTEQITISGYKYTGWPKDNH